MTANQPIIQLQSITKQYPAADAPVLNDINLTITQNQSLAITGPSGSGKTTLLNLIAGLDTPTAGQVLFHDKNLASLTPNKLADFRSRHLGFIFQKHHLLPQLTALENVLVPTLTHANKLSPADAAARAKVLLDSLKLSHRLNHRPIQLSGGECQRVAVARSLINQPDLILADEPTGSLDTDAAQSLTEQLLTLHREQQTTLVVVTHSQTVATQMSQTLTLSRAQLIIAEQPS